ncbi:hypothetical protein AB0N23_01380 [Streptomyces sp. NPDC052644]|uniref:hypothetical protein n=1 Tax=Streptomyces sp. enrichment culture TaxID=1795815 RepID=UPI003412A161
MRRSVGKKSDRPSRHRIEFFRPTFPSGDADEAVVRFVHLSPGVLRGLRQVPFLLSGLPQWQSDHSCGRGIRRPHAEEEGEEVQTFTVGAVSVPSFAVPVARGFSGASGNAHSCPRAASAAEDDLGWG